MPNKVILFALIRITFPSAAKRWRRNSIIVTAKEEKAFLAFLFAPRLERVSGGIFRLGKLMDSFFNVKRRYSTSQFAFSCPPKSLKLLVFAFYLANPSNSWFLLTPLSTCRAMKARFYRFSFEIKCEPRCKIRNQTFGFVLHCLTKRKLSAEH